MKSYTNRAAVIHGPANVTIYSFFSPRPKKRLLELGKSPLKAPKCNRDRELKYATRLDLSTSSYLNLPEVAQEYERPIGA